jgi:hypothetical protein
MTTPSIVRRNSHIAAFLAVFISFAAFAQSPPGFEIADVHIAAKSTNMFMRTNPPHGGRYEIHSASMVDLIRVAYGFDADKILGGPQLARDESLRRGREGAG